MSVLSVGADLFVGEMEEQNEGQSNMMKLKANYHNFSIAPLRDQYKFCHGIGPCLPCIVRRNSIFKSRKK